MRMWFDRRRVLIEFFRLVSTPNARYSLDRLIDSPIVSPLPPNWLHLRLPSRRQPLPSRLSPAPVRWTAWPTVFAVYCYEIVIPLKNHSPVDNAVEAPLARNSRHRCYHLHPHRLQSLQVDATRFKIQSHGYWRSFIIFITFNSNDKR